MPLPHPTAETVFPVVARSTRAKKQLPVCSSSYFRSLGHRNETVKGRDVIWMYRIVMIIVRETCCLTLATKWKPRQIVLRPIDPFDHICRYTIDGMRDACLHDQCTCTFTCLSAYG